MPDDTWAAKFDDKQIAIIDLPIVELQQIADRHGRSWVELMDYPGTKSVALLDVLELAATHLGVEWVRPTTGRETLNALAENVVKVSTDLPVMWTDGDPPEGDQTTA